MSLRGLGGFVVVAAAVFGMFVILVWLLQRRLIYIPYPAAVPPVGHVLPGGREIVLETADGLELGGWFLPSGPRPARGAVLVCNGNAGNRSLRAALALALAAEGLDVLLFDYRGYGGNPGSPSEAGLRKDARAARAWLEGNGTPRERIVYFGESLGTGVAVTLAAEIEPAGLVLRSPFPSLVALGRRHYPFLPTALLLRDRFASAERIGGIRAPLLVIAGDRDSIVPLKLSRQLYAAAGEAKRMVVIEGAGHNDFELLAGRRMLAEIARFVDEVLPRSGPGTQAPPRSGDPVASEEP